MGHTGTRVDEKSFDIVLDIADLPDTMYVLRIGSAARRLIVPH